MFVWVIEAPILGLWSLALVQMYFTEFHYWAVLSQLSCAVVNFALVYACTAFNRPEYTLAVVTAFCSALYGILFTYVFFLLDTSLWNTVFNSYVVGMLPVSAAVGVSLLVVMTLNATAMPIEAAETLTKVEKNGSGSKSGSDDRSSTSNTMPLLIFHPCVTANVCILPVCVYLLYIPGYIAYTMHIALLIMLPVALFTRVILISIGKKFMSVKIAAAVDILMHALLLTGSVCAAAVVPYPLWWPRVWAFVLMSLHALVVGGNILAFLVYIMKQENEVVSDVNTNGRTALMETPQLTNLFRLDARRPMNNSKRNV